MVFYIVIMDITELNAFLTRIGQDLKKIGGPLRGIVYLLEGI